MSLIFRISAILATVLSAVALAQQSPLPRGELRIAYRIKATNGTLGPVVSHMRFTCAVNQCTLMTTEFNGCSTNFLNGERAWFPSMRLTSTSDGSLRMSTSEPDTLMLQERFGTVVPEIRTYKIKYKESGGFFAGATEFSGALTADIPNDPALLSQTLVALKGESPKIKLDCPMVLDGLRR